MFAYKIMGIQNWYHNNSDCMRIIGNRFLGYIPSYLSFTAFSAWPCLVTLRNVFWSFLTEMIACIIVSRKGKMRTCLKILPTQSCIYPEVIQVFSPPIQCCTSGHVMTSSQFFKHTRTGFHLNATGSSLEVSSDFSIATSQLFYFGKRQLYVYNGQSRQGKNFIQPEKNNNWGIGGTSNIRETY